jgi:hypothetical protein
MMTAQASYAYMSGQGYQAIALPYRGGVSMLAGARCRAAHHL